MIGNHWLVRPGMKRVSLDNPVEKADGPMASAYIDEGSDRLVSVFINYTDDNTLVNLNLDNGTFGSQALKTYTTSDAKDLQKKVINSKELVISGRLVVTVIAELK